MAEDEMLDLYEMGDAQLSMAIKYCAEKAVKSSNVTESKEWMEMLTKALSIQRQRTETLLSDETSAANLSLENAKLKNTTEIEKYKVDSTSKLELAKIESQEKVAKINLVSTGVGSIVGLLTFIGTLAKISNDKKVAELNNRSQERCVEMAVNLDKDGDIAYQTASKLGQMPRRK